MPLDIGESVNQITDWFLGAPMLRKVSENPIYTAMIIVFAIMIIVMIIFRDAQMRDSILTMTLRVGFWSLLITSSILFLHNRILYTDKNIRGANEDYDGLFSHNYSDTIEESIIDQPGLSMV
jgi:hypothetical protein